MRMSSILSAPRHLPWVDPNGTHLIGWLRAIWDEPQLSPEYRARIPERSAGCASAVRRWIHLRIARRSEIDDPNVWGPCGFGCSPMPWRWLNRERRSGPGTLDATDWRRDDHAPTNWIISSKNASGRSSGRKWPPPATGFIMTPGMREPVRSRSDVRDQSLSP